MKIMNYVLPAVLSLLGLSCSQDANHQSGAKAGAASSRGTVTLWDQHDNKMDNISARRLESVTWDSVKHQLTWDVSKGEKGGGAYQPLSKDRYEINMDSATMTVNGETRRFSEDEASNVRMLMDFVSRYALESTVWWESGEGDPVDGKNMPARPERQTPRNPHKKEGKPEPIQI